MLDPTITGATYRLSSPTAMPQASTFLWNSQMLMQVNCRGYAVAQFMQPEPAKYAHAPTLEAQTFMQPEQPHYAHHPGRFVYLKDEDNGKLFSAPYEPVRASLDEFEFVAGQHFVSWRVRREQIELELRLALSAERPLELWWIQVRNLSQRSRRISVYPYFPVGYMSWMNQSGCYNPTLQAIVCKAVTPYQHVDDYFRQRQFNDQTFLLSDRAPDSWEARQSAFEGEGGLAAPSAINASTLSNSDALYETPTAALQYRIQLSANGHSRLRLAFGPARSEEEIAAIRAEYFGHDQNRHSVGGNNNNRRFDAAVERYAGYVTRGSGCIQIDTPDPALDEFVNHWLPRQIFYHADVNRLSTDPQTRNYLQDNMGMSYIDSASARAAFIHALSQQQPSGMMPDGILLSAEAQLKYINQVPHTDHCVWLPVCLSAYLDETGDLQLLDELVSFADEDANAGQDQDQDNNQASVFEHICLAMRYLNDARDHRGLSYIGQGDWCDPMNMVGYCGVGVSGWLTVASAYALSVWASICQAINRPAEAKEFLSAAEHCNQAANQHLWRDGWYARGITDDDVVFGTRDDAEGQIFLNPQAWAMLSGAANKQQQQSMVAAIEQQLETPFGVQLLAPAFSKMREDIGRVTQKFPGSAENGSVYNHASAFYVYALYQSKWQSTANADRAYRLLRQMIAGPDQADLFQRGQLPVFIPNYYRGAYHEFPRTAGRSSQLFNTGTVHWFYRCLIDGLFGVTGDGAALRIDPKLPSTWTGAKVIREFRGACFDIAIRRSAEVKQTTLVVDGVKQAGQTIDRFESGGRYNVAVILPIAHESHRNA